MDGSGIRASPVLCSRWLGTRSNGSVVSALRCFFSPEEPVDAIFVGKMPVAAEGHIPQVVHERFVSSDGKLVEDGSQFVIRSAVQVHADRVSGFWCSGGMQPIGGG